MVNYHYALNKWWIIPQRIRFHQHTMMCGQEGLVDVVMPTIQIFKPTKKGLCFTHCSFQVFSDHLIQTCAIKAKWFAATVAWCHVIMPAGVPSTWVAQFIHITNDELSHAVLPDSAITQRCLHPTGSAMYPALMLRGRIPIARPEVSTAVAAGMILLAVFGHIAAWSGAAMPGGLRPPEAALALATVSWCTGLGTSAGCSWPLPVASTFGITSAAATLCLSEGEPWIIPISRGLTTRMAYLPGLND